MTSASEIQPPLGLGSGIEALRAKRGWIIALGIIYVIAGLIALGSVVMATVVSVFVVGIMMLIAGVAEVINAFQVKSWGKFLFWLLLGGLYIVAGFVAFENPLLAAAVLTLILGVALVASGIMRIILAFSMKAGTPWIWVALSSVIGPFSLSAMKDSANDWVSLRSQPCLTRWPIKGFSHPPPLPQLVRNRILAAA